MGVLFLEQLFCGRPMLCCRIPVRLDARDLRLQGFDAGLQLIDREGAEILPAKLGQWILGFVREEVVEIHR